MKITYAFDATATNASRRSAMRANAEGRECIFYIHFELGKNRMLTLSSNIYALMIDSIFD